MLQVAVLKQCDMLDGLRDSILANPSDCDFDFSSLPHCKEDKSGKDCFTTAQVNAIKKIYD
jgi:feruloyl esterase